MEPWRQTLLAENSGRTPWPELRFILLEGSEKPLIPALSLHLSVSQNRWQPPSSPCEDVRKQNELKYECYETPVTCMHTSKFSVYGGK